jgi:predicted methyltransferase
MRRRSFIFTLACLVLATWPCAGQEGYQGEADRLAEVLHWQHGSIVAEIGAGEGQLTLAAAKRVGMEGKVYSTELGPKLLAQLDELAKTNKNIVVIKAGVADTNLPASCCDSIFMRLVYHHLTKPTEIDASLFKSLKPGGVLAVIDEEPRPGSTPVAGVPANRIGHGIPQKVLIEELTSAGFKVIQTFDDWPNELYCVLFRKPSS